MPLIRNNLLIPFIHGAPKSRMPSRETGLLESNERGLRLRVLGFPGHLGTSSSLPMQTSPPTPPWVPAIMSTSHTHPSTSPEPVIPFTVSSGQSMHQVPYAAELMSYSWPKDLPSLDVVQVSALRHYTVCHTDVLVARRQCFLRKSAHASKNDQSDKIFQ